MTASPANHVIYASFQWAARDSLADIKPTTDSAGSGAARALVTGVKLAMEGPPGRVGPLPKNEN